MRLNPKQAKVFKTFLKHAVTLLVGSIRSGKTFISIFMFKKALKEIIQNEYNGDVVLIGKTERTVLRNLIYPMMDMFGTANIKYTKNSGEVEIFGRRCYVISAADESSEEKLRGLTVILALGDEVTTWPENFYNQLLGRMSEENSRAILTTNPDSPFHWLKVNFIDRSIGYCDDPIDMKCYQFSLKDNLHLSAKYIARITKEYVGVFFRRFILGEWCMAEGRIYDMFNEEVHVFPNDLVKDWPEIIEYWVSCDYGTGSVTVFCLYGRDAARNNYIMDEFYYDSRTLYIQKTDLEFVQCMETFIKEYNEIVQAEVADEKLRNKLIIANPHRLTIYCDPTASSFIRQLFNSGFIYVKKAINDVLDGIRSVSTAFSNRKLFIHRRCTEGCKELPNYVWDEKAQLRGEDKPLKTNDHFSDAMRYGFYSRYYKRKKASKLVA